MSSSRFRRTTPGDARPSRLPQALMVVAGLAVLGAAWLTAASDEHPGGKAAPVPEATTIAVAIPASARTAVRDWPSFFQSYGLGGLDGKCAIARDTLRGYFRTNATLEFPNGTSDKGHGIITVVLKTPVPAEGSVGAAPDKAIGAQLAAIGCQAGE